MPPLHPSRVARGYAPELAAELAEHGRICMHRLVPTTRCSPARSVVQGTEHPGYNHRADPDNLDPWSRAPYELASYGGNGTVFQTGRNTCW